MAYFGKANGASAFPATQAIQYEKAFKKRFRDQSIMSLLTNSEWKGRFRGTGTEIKIPVLPVLHSYKTMPGEPVKYQTPKGSEESFVINRERAIALHLEQEDKLFADFNIESPILEEATKVIGEEVEYEFLSDIPSKCAAANTGNASGYAGYASGGYRIGSAARPTKLIASGTAQPGQLVAPDFFAGLAATLAEQPGGKQGSWRCVVPTIVAHKIQTSELKQADLSGDATSTLRKNVMSIGSLAGMDIIVSDKIPYGLSGAATYAGDTGSSALTTDTKVYPIIALDTTAITFADEFVVKEKLQDKDEWGEFHRTKMIYDWFVRYPERFAVGYVYV